MIPHQLQNNGSEFCLVRPGEKAPFEKNWQEGGYKWDDSKLTNWIKEGGNAGILTGRGIVILDCDCRQAENLARTLPETLVVGTSTIEENGQPFRKKHFYFKSDLTQKQILKDYQKHLGEVQALGQQCLIPPSTHPNGARYEVIEDRDIANVDKKTLLWAISPFVVGGNWGAKTDPIKLKEITEGITEGNRNDSMFRLATFYRKAGASKQETFTLLLEQNKKNQPPLGEREIQTLIESAFRGDKPYRFFFEENPKELYSDPNQFFQGKTFVPKRLAETIMKQFIFKTTRDNETLYFYENGIYKEGGEKVIKDEAAKWLGELSDKKRVTETVFHIMISTYIDKRDPPRNLINLKNGIFDLNTMTFGDHDPNIFMVNQLPLNYDENADCPEIKKFVSEIVEPESIPMIQEIVGYCLYPSLPIQTAFLFLGDRNAGKSTLLNLIIDFLGKDNVVNIPLQDLSQRFNLADLYGKLANIDSDLSEKSMKDTGPFKKITGTDRIRGERKREHGFYFWPVAKNIFSCNKIPKTEDHGMAYFKRWRIIQFPNIFEEDNRDPDLLKKMTTDAELSGLFNWSVVGLKRLLKQKEFTNAHSIEETRAIYLRESSNVQKFLDERTELDMESHITKEDLYSEFTKYCKGEGVAPMTQTSFTIQLKMLRPELTTAKKSSDEGRKNSWIGIKFKDEFFH